MVAHNHILGGGGGVMGVNRVAKVMPSWRRWNATWGVELSSSAMKGRGFRIKIQQSAGVGGQAYI